MPSPFPGMDPYLEDYLWPDVHHALASTIRQRLTPLIRPHYVARLVISVIHDTAPETEVGVMYPDVEIFEPRQPKAPTSPTLAGNVAVMEAPFVSPALALPLLDFVVRLVNIEVRDRANNQLVTSIEILSPINKRGEELTAYRQKRGRLERAGVNILEIDLLRRGQRPVLTGRVFHRKEMEKSHYLISLLRADAQALEVWPVQVTEPLPVVAVPLRDPDPDVPLDLAGCMTTIYDEAAYDLSIDYSQKPPLPAFDEETQAWMAELLHEYKQSDEAIKTSAFDQQEQD